MSILRKTTTLLQAGIFAAALFLLPACGNDKPDGADTAKKDTLAAAPLAPEVQGLLASFNKEEMLPYKMDTGWLAALSGQEIMSDKVKLLAKHWFGHELSISIPYQLRDFYKIDSVRASGNYVAWQQTLEPGSTISSTAYAVSKIKLDEKTWALVWGMKYSTDEACPYYSGTDAYVTILHNNQLGETFPLGWDRSSSDAPVWGKYRLTGELGVDGNINLWNNEVTGDADGEIIDVEENNATYMLKIEEGKFKLVNEKKEPAKVERKRVNA